jgi:hypothetical protein
MHLMSWQFYPQRNRHLPPTFAFIDPFDWVGVPFEVVRFILGEPRYEVLISFMYEEINRFLAHRDQLSNFDQFFGTQHWRRGVQLGSARDRNRFLHDLYLHQLKQAAGAKYVRSFQMQNASGLTDYYLFYATNNLLGLQKMKEAMWRVDESGEFTFSDATDPRQLLLIRNEPRYDVLEGQLREEFRGQVVPRSQIENFVLADTPFRETHYKRVLKVLEFSDPPALELIEAPEGRKRGTFPWPSMMLRIY